MFNSDYHPASEIQIQLDLDEQVQTIFLLNISVTGDSSLDAGLRMGLNFFSIVLPPPSLHRSDDISRTRRQDEGGLQFVLRPKGLLSSIFDVLAVKCRRRRPQNERT